MSDLDDFMKSMAEPGPGEREALEAEAKAALVSGHVSVHDALQGWQRGWIDDQRAMQLTGIGSVAEMLDACRSSDIEIRRNT
ncbi:MAG TPA: hypothetical protein VIL88_02455 [Devosia sp.]|jgi:hypothetical protein|uniref:hypothetical protein n=1 Tax=Devosia sp. TaxID=1871048 RepID=UPI002F920C36